MPATSTATRPNIDLTEVEWGVLQHFGAGTGVRTIALRVDLDVTEVQEITTRLVGGDRTRAAAMAARRILASGSQPPAPDPAGAPAPSSAAHPAGPPIELVETTAAAERVALTGPREALPDVNSLDELLAAADAAGLDELAAAARAAVDALHQRYTTEQRTRAARAQAYDLRARLDAALAELATLTAGG